MVLLFGLLIVHSTYSLGVVVIVAVAMARTANLGRGFKAQTATLQRGQDSLA
jgi:hypothetical protein